MTENKQYTYSELNNGQYCVRYTTFEEIYGEECVFHNRICVVNTKKQAQKVADLLNEQEETIQELLQYKYLVKALEEINKTYIEELISDWTDGAYSDKEEQLQLGKYHSENGLSWEDKE